jgi:hypothetical protein
MSDPFYCYSLFQERKMSDLTMLVLIGFIEGFLHYAFRKEIFGKDLPRPAAYTLGTLGLMVPFTFWLLEHSYGDVAVVLWEVLVAGGAVVVLCYVVDWAYATAVSLRESKVREQVATEVMHEVLDDAKK